MARKSSSRWLDEGDSFPVLDLTLTDGSRLQLPSGLSRPFNVVLVNRGAWCPFCTTQLRSFQSGLRRLSEAGIGVVSLSADRKEKAAGLVAEKGLEFPVAWGAPVDAIADALGVYYAPASGDAQPYLQSAGFVLGPGGKVITAVYSSGAIGRLTWQDVLGLVEYVKAHG
jgi:peroxiredoxin